MTTMWPDPQRFHEISTRLLAECQRHSVNAIAGYDYLGYHLAVGVCSRSWPEYPIPALLIRDGQKSHGAKELVAGPRLEVDARVAIVLTDPEGLPIAMERLRAVGYDPCVALNWEAIEARKASQHDLEGV
jgi:hypothetical protein